MLIIFDLDGVLITANRWQRKRCTFWAASAMSPKDIMHTCTGLSLKDILAKIEERLTKGLPAEVAEGIWPATRKLFANRLAPMPGVVPFLQELPWNHCVASSSLPERIRFSLEVTGLCCISRTGITAPRRSPEANLHLTSSCMLPARCMWNHASASSRGSSPAYRGRCGQHARIGFAGGGHVAPGHVERLKAAGATTVVDHWSMMPTVLGR